MGLSKSKVEKSTQQGFAAQPGFSTQPGQFPQFTTPNFGSQTFPTTGSGFGSPAFPSQTAFPPFPAQLPGHMNPFPNNSVFNQPPVISSNGYPVSYPGQPFRPLIPGYAPAPGNDRRGNSLVHENHNQNNYSTRYFQDQQMGQMVPQGPQMSQGKARKN